MKRDTKFLMTKKTADSASTKVILVGGARSQFRKDLEAHFSKPNVIVHRKGTLPWEAIDKVRKDQWYTGRLLFCPYNPEGGQRYYEVDQVGDLKQGVVDLNTMIAASQAVEGTYGKGFLSSRV
jgi:hypothetical protein